MTRTIQLKRLTQSADFRRVRAGRRHCAMPGVVVQARVMAPETPDTTRNSARIGFTVSKRVGNAVARNRAKRRLRAIVAEVMPTAAAGVDYVLIGRTQTLHRPYEALKQDLTRALAKLGHQQGHEPDHKPDMPS